MSDSVDRVFSHALNTVNKIRTGSQKPPSATRLKLYGLYKQAMEGDVDGIMEKPEGSGDEVQRAREKWDAWKQQNNLSRTDAKRRYITTLIDTMHKYASPSPDSRELVAELEFVWDQVKSNIPSSSHSSPLRSSSQYSPPRYPQLSGKGKGRAEVEDDDRDGPLQLRSPMSHSEEELEEQGDEFVDAPDSQYNPDSIPAAYDAGVQANLTSVPPEPYMTSKSKALIPKPASPEKESAADQKWRKRVEQALIKMTAEVAALREQLEVRRLFSHSRKYTFFRFIFRILWGSLKHLALDFVILGIVLLWMRRKKDRRLEGAIRVLLGDAVAQVQRVGGAQLGKIQLPNLTGKKSNSS
ncbi:hypothetical protein K505DRAFT_326439 [Melanomma pulvis-pyrius CBS 109.77]|uniref:ACB domain-containing protein n=1 Tax=Melanomma pulvis-pyrius CBS 109.77 TaxID=1314802 RepID=A0A6A6X6R1_9PLEO|nr:hypothetical protein K505DRAFT_326439 [Melanomma pulvis-pyrius CBS 109.77]